jgi:SAM-dependent methyltransferase
MRDAPGAATFNTPAEAYDRHVGRYGRDLARALIAAAEVQPGRCALDVGCGPGALTTELVAVLGHDHVAAIDPSVPFVEACRTRLPGVRVEVGPAEALPFEDASFDHALAQLVVNFMADPPAGVREMERVTRPGGTVAAAVWDYAGEMTFLRRFWDAAVAVDASAADRDEGRCMSFCAPGELHGLWSAAGLADVSVSPVIVVGRYEDFEDLWEPLERGVGPSGSYVASLAVGQRVAVNEEFQQRLGVADDPFQLTARAWIATGRVR